MYLFYISTRHYFGCMIILSTVYGMGQTIITQTKEAVKNSSTITRPIPKKNTYRNYSYVLGYFQIEFGEREIDSISSDEILSFLTELTANAKPTTKRLRYSNIKSFFNHTQSTFLPSLNNPCDSPTLKKTFKSRGAKH